jgi:predicted enzyme related to lactoylglutathione lyase
MRILSISMLLSLISISAYTGDGPGKETFSLDTVSGLELINVKAEAVEHEGKAGIQVIKAEGEITGETLVIIPGISFRDGTITVELTGEPAPGADPQMRGFVGIAFRVDPSDYSSYECFYLRPTNARADDQMRKNHTTQYIAHPEYPWYRQRRESPGLYESYVDLEPGRWTKMKIEVEGTTARLFVNEAAQPCLIVKDLKHGESEGMVALWLHSSTLARYRDLTVTSKLGDSKGDEAMSQAEHDRRVDYIEFLTTDMGATRKFYSEVFGWKFTDYGPDYSSFADGRLNGGFVLAEEVHSLSHPLVVLYATDLEVVEALVRDNGGKVVKEIFEFPGGRRFHFTDPAGNELAVWSDR